MNDRTSATKSLNHLAIIARELINAAISEGKLLPRDEIFYRNQIDDFEYGEKGVRVGRMSNQFVNRKTWFSGYLADVIKSLKETKEFSYTVDILMEICLNPKWSEIFISLVNFVNDLVRFCLPDSMYGENGIACLITAYLDSLLDKGKLLRFVAEVELTKVVLSVPRIEFDTTGFDKIILRQVTAKDLEYEFRAHDFSIGNVKPYAQGMLREFAYPSAILRIECQARDAGEMAEKIKQAKTILRLFQPAGVDIVDHKIFVEPWITSGSIGSMSTNYSGIERYMEAFGLYQVTKQNSDKFINFWRKLAPKIPEGFYKSGEVSTNYLTIAYQRYCEALLKSGNFEEIVASAVMGLEALLLRDRDKGELGFRLRIYVAKVLGLLDYDSIEVKELVKRAYDIRSTYVHGSKLSNRDEKKLTQHYTSLNKFAEIILDYLRIVIVFALLIEINKDNYLKLIDDALISDSKLKELNEMCTKPRTLL